MACTPGEIDEKPLGRAVCGERIVFFRGPDGAVEFVIGTGIDVTERRRREGHG